MAKRKAKEWKYPRKIFLVFLRIITILTQVWHSIKTTTPFIVLVNEYEPSLPYLIVALPFLPEASLYSNSTLLFDAFAAEVTVHLPQLAFFVNFLAFSSAFDFAVLSEAEFLRFFSMFSTAVFIAALSLFTSDCIEIKLSKQSFIVTWPFDLWLVPFNFELILLCAWKSLKISCCCLRLTFYYSFNKYIYISLFRVFLKKLYSFWKKIYKT